MPSASPNAAAVAVLMRWAQASEEANHTSQAPKTFRRAAKSLREHPCPITCRNDALAVKYIGDKLADSLQGWMDFQARGEARRVGALRHDDEGKWWRVCVADEVAQRSWGRRSATGVDGPGMDNWEALPDASTALRWACAKARHRPAYICAPSAAACRLTPCVRVPVRSRWPSSCRRGTRTRPPRRRPNTRPPAPKEAVRHLHPRAAARPGPPPPPPPPPPTPPPLLLPPR